MGEKGVARGVRESPRVGRLDAPPEDPSSHYIYYHGSGILIHTITISYYTPYCRLLYPLPPISPDFPSLF